jgi:iron complex outermembrane receptor protein
VDTVYVNDVNTESADAYTVVNWRLAFKQASGGWGFTEFARVNNLFDEKYSGSVVLNDSGFAYYEPSPGRNFQVGVSASYAF